MLVSAMAIRFNLRIHDGTPELLPRTCMRCGAPAVTDKAITMTEGGSIVAPVLWTFFLSLGVLVFWIRRRPTVQIAIPLCSSHRYHFARKWLFILLPFLPFLLFMLHMPMHVVMGGFIVCLVVFLLLWNETGIRAIEVRNSLVTMTGVSEQFISDLELLRDARTEDGSNVARKDQETQGVKADNPFDFSN